MDLDGILRGEVGSLAGRQLGVGDGPGGAGLVMGQCVSGPVYRCPGVLKPHCHVRHMVLYRLKTADGPAELLAICRV